MPLWGCSPCFVTVPERAAGRVLIIPPARLVGSAVVQAVKGIILPPWGPDRSA